MKSGKYHSPPHVTRPKVSFIEWDEGSSILTIQARNAEIMEQIHRYLVNEYIASFAQVSIGKNTNNQIEVVAGDNAMASEDALDIVKALCNNAYIGKAFKHRITEKSQQEPCILF